MKAIGGYFEIELGSERNDLWFKHSRKLNSARHAFEFILLQLEVLPSLIYIPYYTCDVILEPIRRLGLNFKFYHINSNLEIDDLPSLSGNEYIVVNNYFGIKDSYIDNLFSYYKSNLIVDNAQAFYYPNRIGIKAFYSPRKFFGVPDGGIAWSSESRDIALENDYSTDRALHLIRRLDESAEAGYDEFLKNETALSNEKMKLMSSLTSRILETIDYERVKIKRRSNFEMIHLSLGDQNNLNIPDWNTFACPMIYPFWNGNKDLRKQLIKNKIFVATYWPNVLKWCTPDMVEYNLAQNIIPIPIDQRYGEEEMETVIKLIKEY